MDLNIWYAFCVACIVISLSPGAGAVNTMSNGIVYGVRHSLPAIMGLQLGYGIQFIVVGAGLGALLASSAPIFTVIKWLGVAYLLYLGLDKFRQPLLKFEAGKTCNLDYAKRFWRATLVNLTNPKATVFLVAFLPQFLQLNQPKLPQFTIMTLTGLAIDIIVMLGYATLANSLSRWMKSEQHQRWLQRVFGSMFIAAAGLMATYQKS